MTDQDVNDWITKKIANNDIVLFMKGTKTMPQCGFSMQVAQILNHLGVDYEDINVLEDMGV
ncbi:MAG: glutaredoxin domain-containing protein, partial [Methyloceanibacter sp.]